MKYKEGAKIELISNIPNEILFVGSIYKQPDLLIEYGQFVRSKYDFYDEVTRFFFDNAEIIYKTRTQTFNKTTISTCYSRQFYFQKQHSFQERILLTKKQTALKVAELLYDLL